MQSHSYGQRVGTNYVECEQQQWYVGTRHKIRMEFEYLCHHIIICAELMFGKRLLGKTIKLVCRLAFSGGVQCIGSCARTFNFSTSKCKCTKNSSSSASSSSLQVYIVRTEVKRREIKWFKRKIIA